MTDEEIEECRRIANLWLVDRDPSMPPYGSEERLARDMIRLCDALQRKVATPRELPFWREEFRRRFVWRRHPEGRGFLYDVAGEQSADEVIIEAYIDGIIEACAREAEQWESAGAAARAIRSMSI